MGCNGDTLWKTNSLLWKTIIFEIIYKWWILHIYVGLVDAMNQLGNDDNKPVNHHMG